MVGSESRLREYLLNNIDDRGHFSQVEAHASQPGIPDLAYTINGYNGWLELKYGTKRKPPNLRMMQYVWFTRNLKKKGNPLIFCGIEQGDDRVFGLIHGNRVTDVYQKKSNKPWLEAMSRHWINTVDWDEFTRLLVTPLDLTHSP